MSELVTTRIRDAAGRLHLANLGENLEALVARAEASTMGYLEFLDLVLEEETGVREGRRFRNALKLSGLPHHKGLDAFDFAFQPDLDARKVRDLAALGFVEQKANVAFLGPPGVGKTMLAVGLAAATLVVFVVVTAMGGALRAGLAPWPGIAVAVLATAAFAVARERRSFVVAGLLAASGVVGVVYGLLRTDFLMASSFPGPIFGSILGLAILGLAVAEAVGATRDPRSH